MSGPKVVRIVTREELVATCEGLLRRLEEERERWQEQAQRIGEMGSADLHATRVRHDALRQLLRSEDFARLQKEVPAEIAFLRCDLKDREERAVARAAMRRSTARNLKNGAASLMQALQSTNVPADPSMLRSLTAIVEGATFADAESILAKGFALLGATSSPETLSSAQRDLAQALQTEEPTRWRTEDGAERNSRLVRIDHYIAKLQTVYGGGSADSFLQRLDAIEGEPGLARRDMLLDSLTIDIANHVARREEQRRGVAALQSLANEAMALLPEEEALFRGRIHALLNEPDPDPKHISTLTGEFVGLIHAETARLAARARREVVLDGLSRLGYEVREGMETAWAHEGRVVLRKTATPGFGVEVGGSTHDGRLQVRAVSLSGTHERSRDRDIETIWCDEFSRLRSQLSEGGTDLTIEKSFAVGELPLKVVALDVDRDHRAPTERSDKGS